ncbi:MAG: hypothetical protein ACFFE2_13530 [Candidatus Thorarchaeota archaeon]
MFVINRDSDEVLKEATSLCHDERELDAEVLVKEQLAADPDNLMLMTKLGIIQARLCNDHEAESTFRAVLVRDPNHEDAVCGLGRLLDQALRTDEAEQIFRDFIQRNPVGHCAVEDLCRILYSEGRSEDAFQIARNQAEEHDHNVRAFDALRYLLQIEEDQIESQLYDDRENESLFNELLQNLLDQIDIVIKILNLKELPDEERCLLEDDRARVLGEIEQLLASAPNRRISVSNGIQKRVTIYKNQL